MTSLIEFVKSNDFEDLKRLSRKFNIFDPLLEAFQENVYSKMLRYFFDSEENHPFGGQILIEFLKRLSVKRVPNEKNTYSRAYFNWPTPKSRYLDILVEIRNQTTNLTSLVIGVETKIDATESENQVVDYQDSIAKEFNNSRKIIIFLTPDGRESISGKRDHECLLFNASFNSLADTIAEVCTKNEASEGAYLKDFSLHLQELSYGGNQLAETVKTQIKNMYLKPENRKPMDNIASYHPRLKNRIRDLMFEKVVCCLAENTRIKSAHIQWCYPHHLEPSEFNFVFDKINMRLKPKLGVGFYWMLYCGNQKRSKLGDRFGCYLMMYDEAHKRTNKFEKLYKELTCLFTDKDLGKRVEWSPWRCLWAGESYETTDFGWGDGEKLANILGEAYEITFSRLCRELKKRGLTSE